MGAELSKMTKQQKQNIIQRVSQISLPHKLHARNPLHRRKKYRKLLILSLDSAGKTSLLYKLKTGDVINTIPTIGYNHENVEYKSRTFSFWDLGGQDQIRKLWEPYFYKLHGIIFLVDSNDCERFEEAKDLLKEIIKLAQVSGTDKVVLLILANKQDLPDAKNSEELHVILELNKLIKTGIHFAIMDCSVRLGTGLENGLEWLHKEMKRQFP